MYLDTVNTFEELIASVDLVVEGTVTDQYDHEGGLSVYSVFEVQEKVYGKSKKQIEILQLKDEAVLTVGSEYILALGVQEGTEDIYYVKGGGQGIFVYEDGTYQVFDELIDEDIKLKKNFKSEIKGLKEEIKAAKKGER